MAAVGFVGLGHMGGNMAARLRSAGYEVYGNEREREHARALSMPAYAGATHHARSPRPPTSSSPRFPTTRPLSRPPPALMESSPGSAPTRYGWTSAP